MPKRSGVITTLQHFRHNEITKPSKINILPRPPTKRSEGYNFITGLPTHSFSMDFQLIQDKFIEIKGVKIIKVTEGEISKACLLSNGEFEFVLLYSSDSFVWSYTYAIKKENH